ncbi:hypothetical protein [Streptosporangium sp. NPDC051022]|uniref:hypothetical protein n=1 Tax=Streptosporangium sp. NPDC051022 TaxID=3155752 RepID=UPI0034183AC0
MTPPGTSPPVPVIPGWRVILSDKGRLWASRVVPFTDAQLGTGAGRTVDADTLDELRAEVARQEEAAEQAAVQANGRAPGKAAGQTSGRVTT